MISDLLTLRINHPRSIGALLFVLLSIFVVNKLNAEEGGFNYSEAIHLSANRGEAGSETGLADKPTYIFRNMVSGCDAVTEVNCPTCKSLLCWGFFYSRNGMILPLNFPKMGILATRTFCLTN